MPLQNRVDPFGLVHAVPARGLFMGNRGGCFHRADRTLKDRRWASQQWIICVLDFKDRKRALMQPGLYTELFFMDEATALAGGHRPCFECRRADAAAFRQALITHGAINAGARAGDMDRLIAGEMQEVLTGVRAREVISPAGLPDGAMYAVDGTAYLKMGDHAFAWSFDGYEPTRPLHAHGLRLTPGLTCEALRAGFKPVRHPTANT